ncbi:MAG TPA: hypothetical protein DCZ94_18580 [Lentisphaeria bacterium]|nr:MAG: hypothetical protein A2X48_24140 [Lentisphaerae bacterium GWF2_49_21]HBC88953.1 hypothetical protein [Lentisphaeria bacterium]
MNCFSSEKRFIGYKRKLPTGSFFYLLAVIAFACILTSGCSSSPNNKNNIRQYPINRPSDWERNNNMPGVSF